MLVPQPLDSENELGIAFGAANRVRAGGLGLAPRKSKLHVLPPRSPKLNGGVERCNGAWRYEFYACTELPGSVAELNPLIDHWQETYNSSTPALSGLTPAQCLLRRQAKRNSKLSQMS
jgi:hypothetical protein